MNPDNISEKERATYLIPRFYNQLLSCFGKQHWWPGDSPWEIAVGAVLTQNTNWRNVEKAINNLKSVNVLAVEKVLKLEIDQLAAIIRPSGYFNLKAKRLRNLATWWNENFSYTTNTEGDLGKLRKSLLSVNGIGEETADSILLYAFNQRTFVVDAYTRKFLLRHQLISPPGSYGQIKSLFENNLAPDIELYKEYHALLVMLGKHYCKTKPQCEECPLNWHLSLSGRNNLWDGKKV